MVIALSTFSWLAYITVESFMISLSRGLFFLMVITPISMLFVCMVTKAFLELYMAMFKMASNVEQVTNSLDQLSDISSALDSVRSITRLIPFMNTTDFAKGKKVNDDEYHKSKAANSSFTTSAARRVGRKMVPWS
jgi:hypothetical protein